MASKNRGSVHLGQDDIVMARSINRDGGLVHLPTMERVSEKPFTWKAQIPITMQHARLQLCMWTGAFMTLGDADNFDMREAIVNECNTVALGSALMGTVMIANMVLLPQYDLEDWIIAKDWPESWATFFVNSWQPFHLVFVTCQVMAMVYCIFVLIALGELTGDSEVRAFAMRIGMKLSGGFVLFFVSLVGYAVWMVLFAIVHNEYTAEALCYTLIPFLFTALGIAYFLFLPVLMELYNVKFESSISQPLVMGRAEIRSALNLFERSIGDPRKISPSNFEMFLMEQRSLQVQKALVFWGTRQQQVPVTEELLGKWKSEDHFQWMNQFEQLDSEGKAHVTALWNRVNGKKPTPGTVISERDLQLVSRLRECKVTSMGVASISYMTSKLIEEELQLLFHRIHGDATEDETASVSANKYQAIRSLPAAGSDTGGAAGGLVYKAPLAADTNRFAPNPAFNPYGQNQGFYAGMGARI